MIDSPSLPPEEHIPSNSGEQGEVLTAPVFDLEVISQASESEKGDSSTPGIPGQLEINWFSMNLKI